jgi:hypothetical protein
MPYMGKYRTFLRIRNDLNGRTRIWSYIIPDPQYCETCVPWYELPSPVKGTFLVSMMA